MTPDQLLRDAELAKAYWSTRHRKCFAVVMTAGDVKKITYRRTIYVRATTSDEAINWAKSNRSMFGVPVRCGYHARLAGPIELGCIEVSA